MKLLPLLAHLPEGIVSVDDHEAHAQTRLDTRSWAYISGGAADELTVRANRQAWNDIRLLPRVLRPLAGGHTQLTLLGRALAHPVLLAPVAYQKLAHPDGELASAHAAAAQGAGLVLSTQASVPMEDVASAMRSEPGHGPHWFQLYLQPDRGHTRELLRRAEAAGYEALVLTVDAPVHGARDRERRAGFHLPTGVRAVHLESWAQRAPARVASGPSRLFDALLQHAPTWHDVAWLQEQTRLPLLLKGVLHPDDGRQAAAMGVAGLIVSNHGGRTLDTTPATASVLPRMAEAVGGLPLLVDGGVRRGTDVLKALALGARAVLIGRPYVYGLASAGAMGVAHVLRLMRDELEIAMALCGLRTLDGVSPALLDVIDSGTSAKNHK